MSNENTSTAPVETADTSNAPAETNETQENAVKAAEAAEPKKSNRKTLKLKIDGQEVEEEIDLDDDETLKRHLQMSKAAQKRMSEAAQVKRQAEQFINMLQTDPISILTNPKMGVDFKKIAEEYLARELENEMLSPEQRRVKDLERELKRREDDDKKVRQENETKQMQELQDRYAQDYDKKISTALSSSGLPKTPKTVKRMAELLHKNLEYGYDLEPQHLVEIVREDYINEIKELFGATDGEMLLKILGEDTATKIRKADLARLRGSNVAPKQSQPKPVEERQQKRQSTEEWLAEVRRRANS